MGGGVAEVSSGVTLRKRAAEAEATIQAYQRLMNRDDEGDRLWSQLQVDSRLGVVEGTLEAR